MLLAPTAGLYGIEGAYLADAMAVAYLAKPGAFTLKAVAADVETRGELTRGMSVFDRRDWERVTPNVNVVVDFDYKDVRQYFKRVIGY